MKLSRRIRKIVSIKKTHNKRMKDKTIKELLEIIRELKEEIRELKSMTGFWY